MVLLFFVVENSCVDELKVCVDNYPPFKIVEKGKITGGLDIELIELLTGAVGLKPKYDYAPWLRCLAYLKRGQTDFVSGITKRKDREIFLHYVEPPYKTKSVKTFYVKKGGGDSISQFKDLFGLTVGVLRGTKYFEKFDYSTRIIKHEVSDESSGLKMVQSDRLDAFITTEEVGDYLIQINHYENDIDKAEYKYEKEVAVYFARWP